MKKLALMLTAAVASMAAWATPGYVIFSSEGPDKYADGTTVLDGEIYALVWTANEAFGGLTATGEPVVSGDKVIGLAATAKDGRCTPVVYMLTGDNEVSGGNFYVYLLDTRVKTVADDGTVVTSVAGLSADGKLTAVNAVETIAEPAIATSTTAASGTVTGAGSVATAAPADAPMPRITAIEVVGAKVVVTVVDTLPCMQYGITAGKTPSVLDQKDLIDGLNGVAGGELKLVIDNPAENRFFKVIRK